MNYIPGHWRSGARFALHRDLTTTGNTGGGTDTVFSYTIPANVLTRDERKVIITVIGDKANNANAKTLAATLGGNSVASFSLATGAAGTWKLEIELARTSEDNQKYNAILAGSDSNGSNGTLTLNDAATIALVVTAAATSDNDIRALSLTVEVLN